MDVIPLLLKEMEQEAQITRKMLMLVKPENFEYKPHEKNMSMQQLSIHLAELPSWVAMGLGTSELDFEASPYEPAKVEDAEALMGLFEKSLREGKEALEAAKEEDLLPTWTMRMGEKVLNVLTKYEVIRHSFSQTTHHRAQLGVYLRLLNIPIPGSYGPSADDMNF